MEKIYGTTEDAQGNLSGTFKSMLWLYADSAFSTTVNNRSYGLWVLDERTVNDAGQKVYIYNNRQTGKRLVVTDDSKQS